MKYSEETFREMYEALKTFLASDWGILPAYLIDPMLLAVKKAESK